jgi:hypothetical protein
MMVADPWSAASLARPRRSHPLEHAGRFTEPANKAAVYRPDRVGLASEAALHGVASWALRPAERKVISD